MTFAHKKRLGIMGGTFDPIHIGHLRAAEKVSELLELDRVCFIPSFIPPHKDSGLLTVYEHRLAMLNLAVENNKNFFVSDIERSFLGPSYTINTLKYFADKFQEAELFFLIGLDAFFNINKWCQFKKLFKVSSFVVFHRPGLEESFKNVFGFLKKNIDPQYFWLAKKQAFVAPNLKSVFYLTNCRLEISSTNIRNLLKEGNSVRYLILDNVLKYIKDKNLYEIRK